MGIKRYNLINSGKLPAMLKTPERLTYSWLCDFPRLVAQDWHLMAKITRKILAHTICFTINKAINPEYPLQMTGYYSHKTCTLRYNSVITCP